MFLVGAGEGGAPASAPAAPTTAWPKLPASKPTPEPGRRRRARFAPSSRRTVAPGPPGRTRSRRSRRRSSAASPPCRRAPRRWPAATGSCSTRGRCPTSLGGDLGKQRARQEPDPGHRPVPRSAGQARRRPAVRAGSHQGRDLSRAGGDRAGRRPGRRPPLRRAGREPLRAEVPARAGGEGGRDRRSASRVPGRAREGSGGRRRASRSTRRRTRTGPAAASSWRPSWSPSACAGIPGTSRSPRIRARIDIKDASFTRHGDLCSRLPEAEQAKLRARDAGRPSGRDGRRRALRRRSRTARSCCWATASPASTS